MPAGSLAGGTRLRLPAGGGTKAAPQAEREGLQRTGVRACPGLRSVAEACLGANGRAPCKYISAPAGRTNRRLHLARLPERARGKAREARTIESRERRVSIKRPHFLKLLGMFSAASADDSVIGVGGVARLDCCGDPGAGAVEGLRTSPGVPALPSRQRPRPPLSGARGKAFAPRLQAGRPQVTSTRTPPNGRPSNSSQALGVGRRGVPPTQAESTALHHTYFNHCAKTPQEQSLRRL